MLRKLLLSTAIIAVSFTASMAADAVPIDDPVPPVIDEARFDWNGLYVGIHGGYLGFSDDFADPPASLNGTIDGHGWLAGIHGGYNYQLDQIVLGIEGDISWADGEEFAVTNQTTTVAGRAEANWEASIRARLGFTRDNWLIYATGGFAWANYNFDYTSPGPPFVFGQGDQFTDTVHGYTLGGGLEYAFNSEWTMRAEYRYSDYDTATGTIIICCAAPPNRQDHDLTTHTLRIGLTRKF